jgi:phosphoribosylformimino-5-aminoimidazole carboxamide ribotide isomerase
MIIFPAIDIQGGQVVRLRQGRFEDVTTYASDPLKIAQQWVSQGAQWLHVIDLDGAKSGQPQNTTAIAAIARGVGVPLQVGGGIRTAQDIEQLLAMGVQRVILGTKVVEDRVFCKNILQKWPERIAVSLDCKDGYVAQRGWTEVTAITAIDLAKELAALGLRYLIYTDIARDGMLTGPHIVGLEKLLKAVSLGIIASGGIAHLQDIQNLKQLESQGLIGAITGKAIYEGTLDLREAIAVCSQNA